MQCRAFQSCYRNETNSCLRHVVDRSMVTRVLRFARSDLQPQLIQRISISFANHFHSDDVIEDVFFLPSTISEVLMNRTSITGKVKKKITKQQLPNETTNRAFAKTMKIISLPIKVNQIRFITSITTKWTCDPPEMFCTLLPFEWRKKIDLLQSTPIYRLRLRSRATKIHLFRPQNTLDFDLFSSFVFLARIQFGSIKMLRSK